MISLTNEQYILLSIARNIFEQNDLELDNAKLKELEWEELIIILLKHKIFPMAYKAIINYVPLKYQSLYDQKYYDICKNINMKMLELNRILKLLKDNKVDVILFKGFALSEIIYGDIYARQFADIDLLVKEADMEKMYYILNDIGYVQETGFDKVLNRYNTIDEPILLRGPNNHEIKCIKEVGDNSYLIVEIKRATSAIPLKHINDFLENVQNININGVDAITSNTAYTFLHLCSNCFSNFENPFGVYSVSELRDIIDIQLFLKKQSSLFNWDNIYLLSCKYEITHKIYYVLKCLDKMFGSIISYDIIEYFNPSKITYKYEGNMDGSINYWESDFAFRLFNDEERKKEFIKSNKLKIYNSKDYQFDNVEAESFLSVTNFKNYRHFYIEPLQWDVEYLVTCDNKNLYFNLVIDSKIYERLCAFYFLVTFVDNNMDNLIADRSFSISKDKALQVEFADLQHCSWQYIELGDNKLIKIIIPFMDLDMNFMDSENRILHNLHCREKIGIDSFRVVGSKYGAENVFLKI